MNTAVAVRQLTKGFGPHRVLDGVTLDVAARESVVILGPSGCGKTTLLRLIAGLEIPDSGDILLNGIQVAAPGRSLVPPHLRGIGFVFQDLALWPHLRVRQHLEFVLAPQRLVRAEREGRVRDVLQAVRIDGLADRYPHELSGGEQQRVAVARAIVGNPRLLLLDEPLSSLDAALRSEMRRELARHHQDHELTAVYVTHDREDADVLANRVVEMHAGRIVSITEPSRKEQRA